MKNIYVVNIYWTDEDSREHDVKRYFTNKKKASAFVTWRKKIFKENGNPEGKIVYQTKEQVNEYDWLV